MSSPEASPVINNTASSPTFVINETSPPPLPPFVTNDTSPPLPQGTNNSPAPAPREPPRSFFDALPRDSSTGLAVGTVLGALLTSITVGIFIFVGICAVCYRKRAWRRVRWYGLDIYSGAPSQPPNAEQDGGPPQHRRPNITPPIGGGIALGRCPSTFSYDELEIATNGFSRLNFLGEGGFGFVHKGVLSDGRTVAIKQLKSGRGQGEREFRAEVDVISGIHHRHLVSLVGYCMAGTQRMLVYEFVPNNTLEFHLHENDRPIIDWPTRMKIAIGSGKGLTYLHEDCKDRIIHRDIKASNILIDDSFEAKLADFGLAKFFPDTDTHISTLVKGTFGYLDPEYANTGKLTDKSDVFSFGVVLLELITGRKPVGMLEWARPLLSQARENGNFDPLVDPRLQNNYIPEEMTRMAACAAACVNHSAECRPRMVQVLRALEGNIALEDLNEGTTPRQNNEDREKFREQALEGQEHSTTSGYLTPSGEFGQRPSTSSSGAQQNTQEMEMKNVKSNTKGSGESSLVTILMS